MKKINTLKNLILLGTTFVIVPLVITSCSSENKNDEEKTKQTISLTYTNDASTWSNIIQNLPTNNKTLAENIVDYLNQNKEILIHSFSKSTENDDSFLLGVGAELDETNKALVQLLPEVNTEKYELDSSTSSFLVLPTTGSSDSTEIETFSTNLKTYSDSVYNYFHTDENRKLKDNIHNDPKLKYADTVKTIEDLKAVLKNSNISITTSAYFDFKINLNTRVTDIQSMYPSFNALGIEFSIISKSNSNQKISVVINNGFSNPDSSAAKFFSEYNTKFIFDGFRKQNIQHLENLSKKAQEIKAFLDKSENLKLKTTFDDTKINWTSKIDLNTLNSDILANPITALNGQTNYKLQITVVSHTSNEVKLKLALQEGSDTAPIWPNNMDYIFTFTK